MRLRVALLVYCFLLLLVASAAGKCRKKKGIKKCEPRPLGPPRWRRRGKDTMFVEPELSTVVLKCQARGNPRPRYRWYRDGQALKKSKKYRRKRYRLTINSLQMSDSGKYTCEVHNSFGSLNRTFTLTVFEYLDPEMTEITIKDRPVNQTAQIGDSVVFKCSTDTYPRPTIEWSRQVPGSPRVDILKKPSSRMKDELFMLDNVTKDDAGLYTCTIKNKVDTRKLTASLVVIGEGEKLPFEPKCGLHVRKQVLYDDVYGCRTREPIKLTYCMGTCGRSYFVPTLVVAAPAAALNSSSTSVTGTPAPNLNPHVDQTCQCCVGLVQGLRVVTLECPSGGTVKAFFTTLRGCTCRACQVQDEMSTFNNSAMNKP